ncbi:MAG: hypothetical protein H7A46_09800 [Verrucomicrobiales bacterium]|nr:hypothetical protein [Verrucomicrobiales bacterium]
MNLPSWLDRKTPGALVSVALEDNGLSVVLARQSAGRCQVARHFSLAIPAARIESAPEDAGRLLGEALQTHGITEKRCVVRLPLAWAMGAPVEMPALSGPDLADFLELRAEKEFGLTPGRAVLAHHPFTLADGASRATLVGVSTQRIESVTRLLQAAGQRPLSLCLGLGNCPYLEETRDVAALRICPAGSGLDLILTVGPNRVTFRHLDGVGSAEHDCGISADTLVREIRLTLGRLPAELRAACRALRFHGPEALISRLYQESASRLRELGWESVERAAYRPVEAEDGALPFAAEAAVEAACRTLSGIRAPLEFLPPRESAWDKFQQRYAGGRRKQLALAAAAIALLIALPAFLQSRQLNSLEARWKAISPKVATLEKVQEDIRRFRPWFDNTSPSLQILDEVTRAFPEDGVIWAKTIELKPGAIFTCTGLARNNQAIMDTLETLRRNPAVTELKVRSVRGENPVQFSFQFTWKHEADT